MQEAFRKAAEINPTSPIAVRINNGKRRQAAERIRLQEERQFFQLRRQFEDVGLMWFGTKIDKSTGRSYAHNLISIEQQKEHYVETLTTLKNRPFEQRMILLRSLASGMRLSEDNISPDEKYRKIFRFVPFVYSGDNLTFTKRSTYFMESISDMSSHSKEQRQEFIYFMVKKSDLTGKVGLPELFPGISRWLDHAK